MALNAVLSALLKEFCATQSIAPTPENEAFEHFINFVVLSEAFGGEFNVADISSGNQEFGLDGVAIIANNNVIEDKDEIDDLIAKNRFLDCDFVFTQSKTSSHFETGDISKTLLAVEDFFGSLSLLQGARVKDRFDLKEYVFSKATYFRRRLPTLSVYYAAAGNWKEDANLKTVVDATILRLRDKQLFSEVNFFPLDSNSIRQLYFNTKNTIQRQITFSKHVPLPAIPGVKQAYIGVLPAVEYLKLVEGDSSAIRKQLFYDNMRDFIADSETNSEIDQTLKSEQNAQFPLRNNGITIVARAIQPFGDVFTIEDYQIVNGCQTSHVLFNNKDSLSKDVFVPVKFIVAENEEVTNSIIRGSNRSNPFDASQLWATEPFHKDLEVFFSTHVDGAERLHYERRKGQYESAIGAQVEKVRIVTPQSLLKSVASMFLERPHDVTKYISSLEPEVGKSVFVPGHNLHVYWVSAYAAFRLEALFRAKRLDSEYKPIRHHLQLGIRLATVAGIVEFGDRDASRKLKPLLDILADANQAVDRYEKLISIAREVQNNIGADRISQLAKSVALRDAMRTEAPKLLV